MQLDIKRALLSPFSDNRWKGKLFILILLSLISAFLTLSNLNLLSWLPIFIFTGYSLQFAHNEIHDIKPILPDWKFNFLTYFKYGAIFSAITFVYSIILFLIMIIMIKLSYILIFGIGCFVFSIVGIWITGVYCDNFQFKDAFNKKKFIRLISESQLEIIIFILIIFVLLTIAFIAVPFVQILELSKTTKVLIISLLEPFIILFINNLIAQIYRIGKNV